MGAELNKKKKKKSFTVAVKLHLKKAFKMMCSSGEN
jgi:hypothetical protein